MPPDSDTRICHAPIDGGVDPPVGPTWSSPPPELAIAGLVSQGRSLTCIYAKLGVRSRTELGARLQANPVAASDGPHTEG